jgi:hypothetical protein
MNWIYRREAASNPLAGDDDMTSIPVTEIWHLEVIKLWDNKHSCLLTFLLLRSRTKVPLRLKLAPVPDVQSSTDRTFINA